MLKKFPFARQLDMMDCGPACLKMLASFYGKDYSIQELRKKSYYSREGVSLRGILEAAESIGFRTMPVQIYLKGKGELEPGLSEATLPCIVHWENKHFVVVYKYNRTFIWIADPAAGLRRLSHAEFKSGWIQKGEKGVALLLEPTPSFYENENEKVNKQGFSFLFKYLKPYRKLLLQLVLGLLLGSLFQLIFPFLTQSIVDIGIQNQNIGFVWLIIIAQLTIFLGQIIVNLLQAWILLHISTRINVSLISDFLSKLMKLPIGFFDTKMVGDLMQRIGDHTRIERFLTGATLRILFALINFLVFGIVLFIYNMPIFLVFLFSSVAYFAWVLLFLRKRKSVDYQKFRELSQNQSALIELIQGMQEIKLQNSEQKRRRHWTNIQARLFRANIRSLVIAQYQDLGAQSINRLKDIVISFIAAKAVIDGQMTLGMMLAIQYIVGQLSGPLQEMLSFIRAGQDAKISLERLGEIHNSENEELQTKYDNIEPSNSDIIIENLSFRYNELEENVLRDINLTIPKGKVTAIVGTSGSGKTTLVKLLLGFYQPQKGTIKLGTQSLQKIQKSLWRQKCGAVMQDGYIFSDSIANNITESEEVVNPSKLLKAVSSANIQSFIEDLPKGYNTMIGAQGNGISQGQKQRLLIARAVYKNPDFLFFDEATNALDAKNERIIVENLNEFFDGKTVVVVAHRLSTVKHADQIVVLERGELKEIGTHQQLVTQKGIYFNLVKDQLELGN